MMGDTCRLQHFLRWSLGSLTFQPFRSLKGITGSRRSFMTAIGTPQGSDGADFGLDDFTQ